VGGEGLCTCERGGWAGGVRHLQNKPCSCRTGKDPKKLFLDRIMLQQQSNQLHKQCPPCGPFGQPCIRVKPGEERPQVTPR